MRVTRSSTRRPGLPSWDQRPSLPSGPALEVSARRAGVVIRLCSMITWLIAGSSAGAPNTFVGFPGQTSSQNYTTYHFHVDFTTPANSTFTTFATPPAAGYTALCPTTRACVPQKGVSLESSLDGIGDRLMFRLAYR